MIMLYIIIFIGLMDCINLILEITPLKVIYVFKINIITTPNFQSISNYSELIRYLLNHQVLTPP